MLFWLAAELAWMTSSSFPYCASLDDAISFFGAVTVAATDRLHEPGMSKQDLPAMCRTLHKDSLTAIEPTGPSHPPDSDLPHQNRHVMLSTWLSEH